MSDNKDNNHPVGQGEAVAACCANCDEYDPETGWCRKLKAAEKPGNWCFGWKVRAEDNECQTTNQ